MFSTDRDLLALEPNLFRDVSFLAQTLAVTTGTLTAGVLAIDDPLSDSTVAPGCVVLLDRTPLEILSITDPSTLVVSLTRPDPDGPQILPLNRAAAPVAISTFQPQLAIIHRQLLAMLGHRVRRAPPAPGIILESAILNPRDLTPIECFGALNLIYSAAAAPLSDSSPQAQRARMYQDRFAQERWRARAEIDFDGDGAADAVRTLNISHLHRACETRKAEKRSRRARAQDAKPEHNHFRQRSLFKFEISNPRTPPLLSLRPFPLVLSNQNCELCRCELSSLELCPFEL